MLALIPARGQSKRIPRKNIKPLGGRPLLLWTIDAAKSILDPSQIVVSTEDPEIAEVARGAGVIVLDRPADLASDWSTDQDVVAHFAAAFPNCERVLYLRPTTPFRSPAVLEAGIRQEMTSQGYSSLRSVEIMPESAYKCYTIDKMRLQSFRCNNGADMSNQPNQLCPPTYSPNGYLDILYPSRAVVGLDVFGACIQAFVTPRTVELDTPEQWEYAEWCVQSGRV